MGQMYNIYCDESCHLENDKQSAMAMGAVWCPLSEASPTFKRIREIKTQNKLSPKFEIKWTKISPAKIGFYLDLVDYFFDNSNLHFRCLVVPDKKELNHKKFKQTHDEWYYKMYFDLLKTILNPEDKYRIYIDIKDTRGGEKVKKLHEVLCNSMYDFDREIIDWVQIVKSDEVELVQISDFLLGAISYLHRGLKSSEAKNKIIERIRERSKYTLLKSTLFQEDKFNIFVWQAKQ